MFKHQDLRVFGSQIKQISVIFTHLKLWVAVARHNFKWVKIEKKLAGYGLILGVSTCIQLSDTHSHCVEQTVTTLISHVKFTL